MAACEVVMGGGLGPGPGRVPWVPQVARIRRIGNVACGCAL